MATKKTALSYKKAGVDISNADSAKAQMARTLETSNKRVLNKVGAFATLFDGHFPNLKHPILVMKTEEPGSKQKIALAHGKIDSICRDMINHLVNDIIVMGATPLAVQDCIVCGKLEKETVTRLVKGIALACKENECVLTGGETSEQPGVISAGDYILTSSIVGVVEKENIIDGSKIKEGDIVLALPSSGVHTNGYSLIRALMKEKPEVLKKSVGGVPFIESILTSHRSYYHALKGLFGNSALHGLAHITGGGIHGNLNRVLPHTLNAQIDLSKIRVLPIFSFIKKEGSVSDEDMRQTYNLGVGMTAVVDKSKSLAIIAHLKKQGVDAYPIGTIIKGKKQVQYTGKLKW